MLAEVDYRAVAREDLRLASGMEAFLARPITPGVHPTMVVLHERYGLVQHTRDLAVRFAVEGHVAIAPNLYWREPNQPAIARGEAWGTPTDDQMVGDSIQAIDYLKSLSGADTGRVAVMGVCATGRHPLMVAAERPDVTACVVFHGAAYRREWVPEDTLSQYIVRSKAPVLGVFGELDNLIAIEDVRTLRDAIEKAERSYHIRLYADAPHGWLNDTMPGRYRRPQAEDAWRLLIGFLDQVYTGGFPADRVRWTFESDYSTSYDFTKNVRLE